MRSPTLAAAALLAATLATGGCGLLQETMDFPGARPQAVVVIDNFETAYIGGTAFISSGAGARFRLGTVSTAGDTRFVYREVRDGDHFLELRLPGQPTIRSQSFILRAGDVVEWDLAQNLISQRAGRGQVP